LKPENVSTKQERIAKLARSNPELPARRVTEGVVRRSVAMPARERTCTAKNRVRELRSPGSVRDEGSNVLVYSDGGREPCRDRSARA